MKKIINNKQFNNSPHIKSFQEECYAIAIRILALVAESDFTCEDILNHIGNKIVQVSNIRFGKDPERAAKFLKITAQEFSERLALSQDKHN